MAIGARCLRSWSSRYFHLIYFKTFTMGALCCRKTTLYNRQNVRKHLRLKPASRFASPQLKLGATGTAYMVETAFWLAAIDDFVRAAFGAGRRECGHIHLFTLIKKLFLVWFILLRTGVRFWSQFRMQPRNKL